jgi:hypothetical protein
MGHTRDALWLDGGLKTLNSSMLWKRERSRFWQRRRAATAKRSGSQRNITRFHSHFRNREAKTHSRFEY